MNCHVQKSVMMGDVTTTTELLQILEQPSVNEFRQLLWDVLDIGSERAFLCFVLKNTFELIGNDGLQSLRNKAIELARNQKASGRSQRNSPTSSCDLACETSADGGHCGPRSGSVHHDLRSRPTRSSRTRRSGVDRDGNLKTTGDKFNGSNDKYLHLNEKEEDVECIKKKMKNFNDKNNCNNNLNLNNNKYFNEKKKNDMLNGLDQSKNESKSDLDDFDIDGHKSRAPKTVTKNSKCHDHKGGLRGEKRKMKNVENIVVECEDMPPRKKLKRSVGSEVLMSSAQDAVASDVNGKNCSLDGLHCLEGLEEFLEPDDLKQLNELKDLDRLLNENNGNSKDSNMNGNANGVRRDSEQFVSTSRSENGKIIIHKTYHIHKTIINVNKNCDMSTKHNDVTINSGAAGIVAPVVNCNEQNTRNNITNANTTTTTMANQTNIGCTAPATNSVKQQQQQEPTT